MGKSQTVLVTHYVNFSSSAGMLPTTFCISALIYFPFRSNVQQQRIVALNTMANLLNLYNLGVYDEIAEIPIEQMFFVLRYAVDDNSPAVLNASMKALRNMFCSSVDETCLDVAMRFDLSRAHPVIRGRKADEDYTVNDQQVAETDLPLCLIRTNILKRIK